MDELQNVVAAARIEPRPYQLRIVQTVAELFLGSGSESASGKQGAWHGETGETRQHVAGAVSSAIVESPTGSGKTVMALLIAKLLQKKAAVRVGWAAMRRNLLRQAAEENARTGIEVDPICFLSMFDKNPPGDVDLLIVDEAQHDATTSMAHLHNVIRPRWILGLTATPYRSDRLQLCFEKVVRDAGIHRLIQDGYLSPYDHFTIPDWEVECVAECLLREPARWGKSLVFFKTLQECFACRDRLASAGIACDVVTGSSDRDSQIAAFEAGQTQVLVNCQVLTEGFDSPDLQTVFCRDSVKAPSMQMCGRVLRKFPGLAAKQIVQSQLTRWPFTKVARPREQWLWQADEWRALTVHPQINAVTARARQAIAATNVVLPRGLLQHTSRPTRDSWDGVIFPQIQE